MRMVRGVTWGGVDSKKFVGGGRGMEGEEGREKIEEREGRRARREKRYLVASDLSDESIYAIEWTIGTVMRDGDSVRLASDGKVQRELREKSSA